MEPLSDGRSGHRWLDRSGYPCTVQVVDTQAAARRWAQTWERAWATKDAEAITALYAPGAIYRSHPMRDPEPGGAFAYTQREFALEDSIECRFGTPVAAGGRASVEWWASYVEDGRELTLAGATVLQFDAEGLVVDHLDYWVEADGRRLPFEGWGGSWGDASDDCGAPIDQPQHRERSAGHTSLSRYPGSLLPGKLCVG